MSNRNLPDDWNEAAFDRYMFDQSEYDRKWLSDELSRRCITEKIDLNTLAFDDLKELLEDIERSLDAHKEPQEK